MGKTREELQRELDATNRKLDQAQHRVARIENRIHDYITADRKARTHRLVTRGAAIESIWPEIKGYTERDFFLLMERVLSLPSSRSVLNTFDPSGGDRQ